MTAILIFFGAVFLFFGGDWLVQGASVLASRFGLSRLLIGLTVVAFGTSAPELAVSVYSSWNSKPDLAVGNIIGSNIINILLVLGVAAIISPIQVSKSILRVDLPFLMLLSILTAFFCWDGSLTKIEGLSLFLFLVAYLYFSFAQSKKAKALSIVEDDELDDLLEGARTRSLSKSVLKVVSGIALLVLGSKFFIDGSVEIARGFGVSELVIGVTMVALGTSLPELATTVTAAFRGEKDIALGNIVGSNIFNLLAVLGLSAVVSPVSIKISEDALNFDFPFMLAVTALCFPFFAWKLCLTRPRGVVFVLLYSGYIYFLFDQM